jgi:hypothetical protein
MINWCFQPIKGNAQSLNKTNWKFLKKLSVVMRKKYTADPEYMFSYVLRSQSDFVPIITEINFVLDLSILLILPITTIFMLL